MQKRITKAVFPVAGLGRRFLPLTKASPKEMLPVVDKPLIQFAVEEAAAAGITEMIFIAGRNKRSIEDHFDRDLALEHELAEQGKRALLESVKAILPRNCHCIYIRQPEALGLGHAVLCAQPVVRDQPFAVLLADDLIDAEPPTMARMAARFESEGCSLLGVEDVPREQTGSYGIVSPADPKADVTQIHAIVEKPAPKDAPSTLAVVGRYVLTPAIFDLLAAARPGSGGEIQLTDAIAALLGHERVLAMRIGGKRYDCGSKLGYLKATVELGLRHPEVGKGFAEFLSHSVGAEVTRVGADVPDLQASWAFLEHSDLISSAGEVEAAIGKVAAEIEDQFKDRYPLVLVVMGGAVVFAGQLLPRLRMPLDLDYIHASRYGAATSGGGIEWRVAPPRSVRGRAVLVLDDILDGGHTMCAIRDRLLELGAKSFHCAVLVEKILPQRKPIAADFVGLRIPDRFVFGCGMDAKGFWRNLPEIRAMRGS